MPPPYAKVTDHLFAKMDELVPPTYPSGVVPTSERIKGTAFFPGGDGLYFEDRDRSTIEFPVGGVMILGHNFDSERGFKESLKNGIEALKKGTWGNLRNLLDDASVPLDQCFFTNVFMGLCEGDDNKKYLGRSHPEFRASCLNLLKVQIGVQRPRLILALGIHVPPALANFSDDLGEWKGKAKRKGVDRRFSLRGLDAAPIISSARFGLEDGSLHSAVVTGIAHPSDQRNGRLRRPTGFVAGSKVEVDVVRSAWMMASR